MIARQFGVSCWATGLLSVVVAGMVLSGTVLAACVWVAASTRLRLEGVRLVMFACLALLGVLSLRCWCFFLVDTYIDSDTVELSLRVELGMSVLDKLLLVLSTMLYAAVLYSVVVALAAEKERRVFVIFVAGGCACPLVAFGLLTAYHAIHNQIRDAFKEERRAAIALSALLLLLL